MKLCTRHVYLLACFATLLLTVVAAEAQPVDVDDYILNLSAAALADGIDPAAQASAGIADLANVDEWQFLAHTVITFTDAAGVGQGIISVGDTFTAYSAIRVRGFTDNTVGDITPPLYGSGSGRTHEITALLKYEGTQLTANSYSVDRIIRADLYFDAASDTLGTGFTPSDFSNLSTFEDGVLVESFDLTTGGGVNTDPVLPNGTISIIGTLTDHLGSPGFELRPDGTTFAPNLMIGVLDSNNNTATNINVAAFAAEFGFDPAAASFTFTTRNDGSFNKQVEITSTCGDGFVDSATNETCDPPGTQQNNGNLCRSDCTYCGDQIVDNAVGEQCDDGNLDNFDGCHNDCTVARCGDGVLDPGEQCDDGNTTAGDGCSPSCTVEECGNGILDPGEQCDDGNTSAGDGCSPSCTVEECGNGILDPGEQCDDGNTSAGDGCSPSCTVEECGNGILDPGEQCDDGNTADGDGCSANCTSERCGNGILDPGELCDDGNNVDGDGCSATCIVEACDLTVVKTASPEIVDCSTPPPPPADCGCDGKVTDLTLRYNGTDTAFVTVQQKKDGKVVFSDTVDPGEVFSFIGADKKWTLGTEIQIYVNGHLHTKIHTSCSQPIGPGLVSGDFEVVDGSSRNGGKLCPVASSGNSTDSDSDSGIDTNGDGDSDSEALAGDSDSDSGIDRNGDGDSDSEALPGDSDSDSGIDTNGDGDSDSEATGGGGSTPPPAPTCSGDNVTYTYVVTNNGPPVANVQVVDDKLGTIATIPALATGEGQTVTKVASVCADTTNTVTVTGSLATGALCEATDTATVICQQTPPEEPCGCEGKVTSLTLRYLGSATALIRVEEKKDHTVVFEGDVDPNMSFLFTGTDKHGTLGTEIEVYVNGDLQTKIHTSCSQPIGPGLIRGDFEVVDGASREFSLLCAVDSPCGGTSMGDSDSDSGIDRNGDGDSDSEALPGDSDSDSGIDTNHDGDSDSEAALSGCPNADSDSGEDSNGDGDSDSEDVTTPESPPTPPATCGCDGKVTNLTLRYNGATAAFVEVQQKKGKRVYKGTVIPGGEITLLGADKKGTLGTEITIYVEGKFHAKIHTSCSQPIGPGLVRGDFEVVDGTSRNGGDLCPVN